MDWKTILKAQQADFIARLESGDLLLGLTQLAQAMPAAGYAYAKLKYICIIQVMNGQRGAMPSLVDSTKV
ncbi:MULTISPECIES: hypothetical protein [Cyanophyceae]|uniref:hypothetical protein n=1 Tax=Cyanophyceae TaxID=3028117 RepID=UPI0023312876|nr:MULTISPECIES: hypothetical protein [Cyanophyceae]MDB9355079.1 hypothetical protein [Nodularia spumigena CS-587/03]MDB9316704.1 hypothetical protein [Nodularia spumigena CS-590/01A]MDB9321006.1 hypothetical protein [Nodularia spumigena CS-591/07A]MDB9328760.1 hypothetical protein [Nodularia spumigena CS-590/02]MDB9333333.1 hypothetical protein [Nodularia spumigena CS-591/04]